MTKDIKIIKRDGSLVDYDENKVINAIKAAMTEVKGEEFANSTEATLCQQSIEKKIRPRDTNKEFASVEDIQDQVETELMSNYPDVAKAYILYRNKRAEERATPITGYKYLDGEFLNKYRSKKDSFKSEYGRIVYKRTYARPIQEEKRREDWWETVARVVDYSTDLEVIAMKRQGIAITQKRLVELKRIAEEMYDHMFNLGLFPSGRSLWIGGSKAAYEYPISNLNCSFITLDELAKFGEMFFVLMLGTGVGVSVEREYVSKLPKLNTQIEVIHKDYKPVQPNQRLEHTELTQPAPNVIQLNVGDAKYGWSRSMELYFDIISKKQYSDIDVILINYDNVRPAGEPLKTFGGFASGHTNLKTMFEKIDVIVKNTVNKQSSNPQTWGKLKPIDVLDISTVIAENVVSGGTRRSALIIFTDPDEEDVIKAKENLYTQDNNGNWRENKDLLHRSLSNNTIKYYGNPGREALRTHVDIIKYTGEPGFDNMQNALKRRLDAVGFNPCNEIILRDRGVCNLTEINMAHYVDENGNIDYHGLYAAQRLSAIIGYRMATIELELHEWNLVHEEDRLVGCSLTGMIDFMHKANLDYDGMRPILRDLRHIATTEANALADFLGMNRPKLVTTIKPSGTISQLPTTSSGLHFNHSQYYIRRVRINAVDPLAIALDEMGFKWNPEVGQTIEDHTIKVFEFPIEAPKGRYKKDVGAIEQLEWYKLLMNEYVDHNASITVHVRDDEWDAVADWLYENWDDVLGISFLPYDGGVYQLAPYEEITESEYKELQENLPKFDDRVLKKHERFEEEFDVLDSDCDSGLCPVR